MTSKEDARTKDSHTNASRRGGHLEEVGISQDLKSLWDPNDKVSSSNWHPAVTVGFGLFVFVQLVPLLSLPPVLRSRGAPYLPTFQKRMEAMFRLLREEQSFQKRVASKEILRFVDLGSGDGRLVFRAARERIFGESSGYEINPLLHLMALTQKILYGPYYWTSTSFFLQDIWTTNLCSTHVVAVYGLGPIMGRLGQKLKRELPEGSIILSNTFTIPGWKHTNADHGIYVYRTPNCWE